MSWGLNGYLAGLEEVGPVPVIGKTAGGVLLVLAGPVPRQAGLQSG